MSRVIRVLLVDDQPLVRAGLRLVLDTEPDISIVAEAGDGAAALQAAREHRPDLVMMDIRMPRMDGISATRAILADASIRACRVIVLTTFDEEDVAYQALCAGASGFLLKDAPVEQMVSAVRGVADGHALIAPSTTRRLIERMTSAQRPDAASALDRLTDREREVLLSLARGRSNAEIADDLVVSEATVKTHVSRLLAKLGVRDRVHAVIVAYEWGVVSPGG